VIFRRATIRLTIAFTLIQLALFAIFAIALYSFVTGTFDFDAAEHDGEAEVMSAEQGFALLRNGIIICYAGLLVVVPALSWVMARAALLPIKASFERQQQFVDGASHEMRTPLSVIQGELELALTRPRSLREYQAAIERSLDAVAGMTRLTDDLLKLSRASKGDLEGVFAPVDVDEVIRAIVDAVPDSLHARVQVTMETAGSSAVWGSEELISRALGNIVDNAVKYADPSGVIRISRSVEGQNIVVSIHDDGPGMTEEQVSRAFERFWRADAARTTPGHGLGLALVEQIVKAHKGTVSLDSGPRGGTTVTVKFPPTSR
jgi:signal transduction histidine kinase